MSQFIVLGCNVGVMLVFEYELDSIGGYWFNWLENILLLLDMMGVYMCNWLLLLEDVVQCKVYIIGIGIVGLVVVFYLICDGGMLLVNIMLLDSLEIEGGLLDGVGDVEQGYLICGGCEMNWNYDNFWDLFQDVLVFELLVGFSVFDEYCVVNDNDLNWFKVWLLYQQGKVKDFVMFGLSCGQ